MKIRSGKKLKTGGYSTELKARQLGENFMKLPHNKRLKFGTINQSLINESGIKLYTPKSVNEITSPRANKKDIGIASKMSSRT
jgi:hypothetical protein